MKGIFKTLISFGKISDLPLYSLDYAADYQLERLLAMGAGSYVQFAENVCKILLGDINPEFRIITQEKIGPAGIEQDLLTAVFDIQR